MANLCIKTPSSASLVLIFQLMVLRPRPNLPGTQILVSTQRSQYIIWPCMVVWRGAKEVVWNVMYVLQVFGIVAHLQFLRNISRSWLSTPAADPLHKFPPLKYLQILHHSQKLLLSKKTLAGHLSPFLYGDCWYIKKMGPPPSMQFELATSPNTLGQTVARSLTLRSHAVWGG